MRPGLSVHVADVPPEKDLPKSRETLPSPWRVRWSVNGKWREKNFRTRAQAVSYWSDLTQAVKVEYDWDLEMGLPVSWGTDATMTVAEWVHREMKTKRGGAPWPREHGQGAAGPHRAREQERRHAAHEGGPLRAPRLDRGGA